MSASRRPWTAGEVMLLEELAGRNISRVVIALKLGRTVAAVDAKAAQLGIQLKRTKRAYRRKIALASEVRGQV